MQHAKNLPFLGSENSAAFDDSFAQSMQTATATKALVNNFGLEKGLSLLLTAMLRSKCTITCSWENLTSASWWKKSEDCQYRLSLMLIDFPARAQLSRAVKLQANRHLVTLAVIVRDYVYQIFRSASWEVLRDRISCLLTRFHSWSSI